MGILLLFLSPHLQNRLKLGHTLAYNYMTTVVIGFVN